MKLLLRSASVAVWFIVSSLARAENAGKLQILLLGDSTTEAKIPKVLEPEKPQFEDLVDLLLAAEGDLPKTKTTNSGISGETIRRLVDSGRYEKEVTNLPGIDYVFIRYGLNDHAKRDNFEANFVYDFRQLVAMLRGDHPQALLIPTTVIPFGNDDTAAKINRLVQSVAAEEGLAVFDLFTPYRAALLASGPNTLTYRRLPLDKVPTRLRVLAEPYSLPALGVVIQDNRLDAHFGHLPGWFGDRHPNHAGYHLMAELTAKYLAPIIRQAHPAGAEKAP
jgi:lysophospholipase L1-like esterase